MTDGNGIGPVGHLGNAENSLYMYNTKMDILTQLLDFKNSFDIHFLSSAFTLLPYVSMYSVYIAFMYLIICFIMISCYNVMQINL